MGRNIATGAGLGGCCRETEYLEERDTAMPLHLHWGAKEGITEGNSAILILPTVGQEQSEGSKAAQSAEIDNNGWHRRNR